MPDDPESAAGRAVPSSTEVGAYCREVEGHLTRLNGGHLVRIVGPAFELVRQWAADAIPMSVVVRGIERKVARHQAGAARRPLRIEFCEADVREVFTEWRRAVGVLSDPAPGLGPVHERAGDADSPTEARRTAMHALDRAIERLSRAAGRLDWPEKLRDVISARLAELTAIREEARGTRGERRGAILARVASTDPGFAASVREAAPPDLLAGVLAEAARELSGYRARLSAADWTKAVDVTAHRLLRDRLGLPG